MKISSGRERSWGASPLLVTVLATVAAVVAGMVLAAGGGPVTVASRAVVDAPVCGTTWQASDSGLDGSWTDTTHWTNGVPTSTTDACLPAGAYSVLIANTTASVKTLEIGSPSSPDEPTVTVGGGGEQPALLSAAGDVTNAGTIVLYAIYGDTVGIAMGTGATLTNTGTLSVAASSNEHYNARTLTGAFVNEGTLDVAEPMTVGVAGDGSSLTNSAAMTVAGSLSFSSGATFIQAAGTLTNTGSVVVASGAAFDLTGGTITASTQAQPTQPVTVYGGATLTIPAGADTAGAIHVIAGTVDFTGDVPEGVSITVGSGDERPAELSAAGDVTNAGTIVLYAIYGDTVGIAMGTGATLTNTGTLNVAASPDEYSNARTLTGTFINDGALQLDEPLTLDGDLTQGNAGTLAVVADGNQRNTYLSVTGTSHLGGTIEVSPTGTYVPADGDTNRVLTAPSLPTGTFAATAPAHPAPGLAYQASYDSSGVIVTVVAGFHLTVSIDSPNGGSVSDATKTIDCAAGSLQGCDGVFTAGGTDTLTASPPTDDLTSWTGCASSSGNTCTVSTNQDAAVGVTFTHAPLLTAATDGDGFGAVVSATTGSSIACNTGLNVCSEHVPYANGKPGVERLNAIPAVGSYLSGWNGCDDDGQVTCQVTVPQATTVTAAFLTCPVSQCAAFTGPSQTSPPQDVVATAGDGSATVTFQAPANTYQETVTGYDVTAHPDNAGTNTDRDVTVSANSSPVPISGLTNGVLYDISVVVKTATANSDPTRTTVIPSPTGAVLTASVTSGTAPLEVTLDASQSTTIPKDATFTFYCGDIDAPVGPASSATSATCTYFRASPDAGWRAWVSMLDPATGKTYQATVVVDVAPASGTVDDSAAFTTGAGGQDGGDLIVAPDGSLASSDASNPDSANYCGGATVVDTTCVVVEGSIVRLTAAPGTFAPGTSVQIYHGDTDTLNSELGPSVHAQGGFAVTWTTQPAENQPLRQPLTVTVTPGGQTNALTAHADQPGLLQARDLSSFWNTVISGVESGVEKVASAVSYQASRASYAIGYQSSRFSYAWKKYWSAPARTIEKPNDSTTNNLLFCSSVTPSGADSVCNAPWTVVADVDTERISALSAAGYVIAAGGGNVIAAGGGNVIAAGGGNVIAAGGGNVIAAGAGNVIAAGGGNVIAAGGGNVIAAGGGNVIAAGGGNFGPTGRLVQQGRTVAPHDATSPSLPTAGADVVAAGNGTLTIILTNDPGFAFVTPAQTTPPTVTATTTPDAPVAGDVTVHLSATGADGTPIQNVTYSAAGAQSIASTTVAGGSADLVIDQPGTTTITYAAEDADLNDSTPQTLDVTISPPAPAGAPTGVMASLVDPTSAAVSWTAPSDPGGAAISGYTVQVVDGGSVADGSGAAAPRTVSFESTDTTQTIGGLTPGHTYVFTVSADNGSDGTTSEPSPPLIAGSVPDAPTGLTATPGTGQVTLTWTAPATDGGMALNNYFVYRSTTSGGPYTKITAGPSGLPTGTTYTDTTAAAGTTYYYVVTAENAKGESAYSNEAHATPPASAGGDGGGGGGTPLPAGWTVAGGTSSSADGGPLPSVPVVASVTTPNAGVVSFTAGGPGDVPPGFTPVGQGFVITAPTASVTAPLQLTFAITDSALPAGIDAASLTVFRDQAAVAPCAPGAAGTAAPDPCVASRTTGGGVTTIVVLSSHASAWAVGIPPGYSATGPVRVLDTRNGTGAAKGQVGPKGTITLTVPNLPTGATGVVLNLAATGLRGAGASYVSACPVAQKLADCTKTSALNAVAGRDVANEVIVPVAPDGKVTLYNNAGSVDLVADLVGYELSGFTAAGPTRVLDTRDGIGAAKSQVGPKGTITLTVPKLPAGTTAAVLNLAGTGLADSPSTYVSACPAAQPLAACTATSALNVVFGQDVSNEITVPVGPDGKITLYNNAGSIDLVADLVGYQTGGYTSTAPTRILDTRDGTGAAKGQVGPKGTITLTVPKLPAGTTAAVLNLAGTGLADSPNTYVSACPAAQPLAACTATSALNAVAGQDVANEITVPVGPDGKITLYNNAGSIDLVADLVGYQTG